MFYTCLTITQTSCKNLIAKIWFGGMPTWQIRHQEIIDFAVFDSFFWQVHFVDFSVIFLLMTPKTFIQREIPAKSRDSSTN